MTAPYTPARGDLVWLEFNPQAGHEQAGRRPALVVSPRAYNARTGLALFCPLTTHVKGYPFEVELVQSADLSGEILADQLKSLDWRARRARFIGKLSEKALGRVLELVGMLVSPDS